jgi:hypothetical protein
VIANKRVNFQDITGQVFGRLTVIEYNGRRETPSGSFKSEWKCACECGNQAFATTPRLRSGAVRSCGCLARELNSARMTTHGLSQTPEYQIYCGMVERCGSPKSKDWPRYGGRGIKVCDEWLASPEKFVNDMGPRPSKQHSIERINTDGPYSAANCTWATAKEQCNNKTNTRRIRAFGVNRPITEWAAINGLKASTIARRLDAYRWLPELAVSKPARVWLKK